MAYLVMRSYADAKKQQNGKSWIELLKGNLVDDNLGPQGGFIVETEKEAAELASCRMGWSYVAYVDARTEAQVRAQVRPEERRMMQEVIDQPFDEKVMADDERKARVLRKRAEAQRVLESIEADVQKLLAARKSAVVAKTETKETPAEGKAEDETYHDLQRKCKALMEVGGPAVNLKGTKDELVRYLAMVGEPLE